MSHQVEPELVVPVSSARAWRAFADSRERSQWEAATFEIEPRVGGRVHWALPGHECEGRVEEAVPERLLRHREHSGPHADTEVTVRFEPVEGGTRISITHAGPGFGAGEDAALAVEATTIGWAQGLADLRVLLDRGVPAGRFMRPWTYPGMRVSETPAGVEIRRVDPGGFADQAGLRAGDLLLALGGAPVFTQRELWVLQREHGPGDKLTAEYLRGSERLSGTGTF